MEKEPKSPRERAGDLINLLISDWRPSPRRVLWAIRIGIVLSILVAIGYSYGITLWDWIKLLIVPAVIAGGGLWFNQQQQQRQREEDQRQQQRGLEIEQQRAQDEALQAYLDQMSSMLIPNTDQPSLYKARPGDSLSSVARARTLTVLPRLDGERKARVVQFLYESGLISKHPPILLLRGADLSGANFTSADLRGTNLSGTNLSGTNLHGARLIWAKLSGTNLRGAKLIGANLKEADLSRSALSMASLRFADLSGDTLRDAIRSGANVKGTNLSNADLRAPFYGLVKSPSWTEEQLSAARVLAGATMPRGGSYEN